MKTKNLLIICMMASLMSGCHGTEPEGPGTDPLAPILFLNNGNWNSNDAGMTLFDMDSRTISADVFARTNGRNMGDLAQDIIKLGDGYAVSMNGSQLVYVLGGDFKVKREIIAEHEGVRLSPRCLAEHEGKIYVSYYEGYLGEIDPLHDYALRLTPVGPNPDGLVYAAGKVYVANSGGYLSPDYGTSVSVVDAASFVEEACVTVNNNPVAMAASRDGSSIYVCSWGNYADKPSALERIDAVTLEVSPVDYQDVRGIAAGAGDILYVVTGGYDENWQITGTINSYDMAADRKAGVLTEEKIPSFYSISADPSGLVFAGSSDYTTEGDMYIFDDAGQLLAKAGSGGLNPIRGMLLQ